MGSDLDCSVSIHLIPMLKGDHTKKYFGPKTKGCKIYHNNGMWNSPLAYDAMEQDKLNSLCHGPL
jgi:hypothetical protein